MTSHRTAVILSVLTLILLFSACQEPAYETQGPQVVSNVSEVQSPPVISETPPVLEDAPSAPAPDEAPEETEHPLMGVLKTVTAKLPEGTSENDYNRGLILDFNEDNVDELLLTYRGVNQTEQRLEIWTVRDGKPALLWEETLFECVEGPVGGIRMVTKDEVPYLCIYRANFGARGIADNCQFMGSLDFYSPTYQTAEGLYRQYWLAYDFFGPDDRTPAPDEPEPDSYIVFDGQDCSDDVFQAWMAAFDQSAPSILQVGGFTDGSAGMRFSDLTAALSQAE